MDCLVEFLVRQFHNVCCAVYLLMRLLAAAVLQCAVFIEILKLSGQTWLPSSLGLGLVRFWCCWQFALPYSYTSNYSIQQEEPKPCSRLRCSPMLQIPMFLLCFKKWIKIVVRVRGNVGRSEESTPFFYTYKHRVKNLNKNWILNAFIASMIYVVILNIYAIVYNNNVTACFAKRFQCMMLWLISYFFIFCYGLHYRMKLFCFWVICKKSIRPLYSIRVM